VSVYGLATNIFWWGLGMGFIYVDVELRGAKSSKVIRMLVDTGSTYVVLSSDIIGELGLIPTPYTVDLP
jgi:predicted aspartyl protease